MKKLLILVLALVCLLTCAWAEEPVIRYIADESELPQGWAEKDLLRLTFVDVQRSDAILLQCGGENMLLDGGLGQHYLRVFRVLDDAGVTGLKYLWNTHCDGDHSQGLKCLMNSDLYGTGVLLCPNPKTYNDPDDDHEKMVRAADRHGWTYQQIAHGEVFTLGGAQLTVVRCGENYGQNNRSAAARVEFGGRSIFLAADIGVKAQEYLAAQPDAQLLDCDILKAPHHGLDAVNPVFVGAVSPEGVVITNMNASEVDAGWKAYQPLYAGDGVVVLETDGNVWYAWQLPNWLDHEMGT
jgi:beta-lactamase superfamily II metal-dependent hydrolase